MRGLPVLRSMQNRDKEFNPRAFKVFGPKIVAMRGSYDDDALESRFISEDMNARTLRDDIPVHLPSALRAEALSLRNRLLHFRFCSLFSMAIDPTAISRGASARINQITLPLLSLVDDPETKQAIQQVATRQAATMPRLGDAQLTEIIALALQTAFADPNRSVVSVGEITREVNGNP